MLLLSTVSPAVEGDSWTFSTHIFFCFFLLFLVPVPGSLISPVPTDATVSGKIEFAFSEPVEKNSGSMGSFSATSGDRRQRGFYFVTIPSSY